MAASPRSLSPLRNTIVSARNRVDALRYKGKRVAGRRWRRSEREIIEKRIGVVYSRDALESDFDSLKPRKVAPLPIRAPGSPRSRESIVKATLTLCCSLFQFVDDYPDCGVIASVYDLICNALALDPSRAASSSARITPGSSPTRQLLGSG